MFCDHLFTALLVKSEKLLQVKAFYIFTRHASGLYLSVAAPGRRAADSRDSVYTYTLQVTTRWAGTGRKALSCWCAIRAYGCIVHNSYWIHFILQLLSVINAVKDNKQMVNTTRINTPGILTLTISL